MSRMLYNASGVGMVNRVRTAEQPPMEGTGFLTLMAEPPATPYTGPEGPWLTQADLDEYAQSLASVVLGILHTRSSADLIWDLFQRTKQNPENFFVGALWGLIDLQDPRIADALAELIQLERVYYEMFGFIARAGDERTVMPMASVMVHGNELEHEQASYALPAVAHRVGRKKVIEALTKGELAEQSEMVERTVDKLLQYPMDAIEDYFEMYYRGMA